MTNRRYSNLRPEMLCGRKVWVCRRHWAGPGVPEVWVHTNPFKQGIYIAGRSLIEGTDQQNLEYLASLLTAELARIPVSNKLDALWDREAAYDAQHVSAGCL